MPSVSKTSGVPATNATLVPPDASTGVSVAPNVVVRPAGNPDEMDTAATPGRAAICRTAFSATWRARSSSYRCNPKSTWARASLSRSIPVSIWLWRRTSPA